MWRPEDSRPAGLSPSYAPAAIGCRTAGEPGLSPAPRPQDTRSVYPMRSVDTPAMIPVISCASTAPVRPSRVRRVSLLPFTGSVKA